MKLLIVDDGCISREIIRDDIPDDFRCGFDEIETILKEYYDKQGMKLVHFDPNSSIEQRYVAHVDDQIGGAHYHDEIHLIT